MISKIIQKEKDIQNSILETLYECPFRRSDSCTTCKEVCLRFKSHKQNLVNLKEYMGKELSDTEFDLNLVSRTDNSSLYNIFSKRIEQLKEDIKELNTMIDRYK